MTHETFNLPELGDVLITKVYEFYDRPIIFSISSSLGFYVVSLVESRKDFDKWIAVPISRERLSFLENGRVSLKEVFRTSSENSILFFKLSVSGEIEHKTLGTQELTDDILPSDDYFININDPTESTTQAKTLAELAGLTLVNLKLLITNGHKSTVPLKNIGVFFQNFQESIDNIAMNMLGNLNLRGRIPTLITQQTTLEYAAGFNSSVGVSLISRNEALLENGVLSKTLDVLGYLIQANGNIADIAGYTADQDITLSERSLIKFKGMLISLSNVDAGIQMEWEDRNGRSGSYYADSDSIKLSLHEISKIVDSTDRFISISGRFASGDIDTHRFKIIDNETGIQYTGYSEESMESLGIPIELGRMYKAFLRETMSVNPASGQEAYTYSLISLKTD